MTFVRKSGVKTLARFGGGPAAGIEIGAVRAFEEKETDFDIFSCTCRRLVITE